MAPKLQLNSLVKDWSYFLMFLLQSKNLNFVSIENEFLLPNPNNYIFKNH